jgi:CRP/FNR family transcriptional regulator, cyclic AMP receptor protein
MLPEILHSLGPSAAKGVAMFTRHGVPDSRLEFLRKVPFFDGLNDKTLARIDSHLDEVTVGAGRTLTEQGRGAYETFIVADGTAEVRVSGEVVGETAVGELIGEIGVLKNTLRTATVVAKTPMRLLVVGPRELDWLFEDPILAERVQANLDRHLAGKQPSPPEDSEG